MFSRENFPIFMILFFAMIGAMAMQVDGVWDIFDIGAIVCGICLFGMVLLVNLPTKG